MTRWATVSTIRAQEETGGPRRWFRLVVHDTLVELREAAHRFRPEYGADWWTECAGCFHPAPLRRRYDKDGTEHQIDTGYSGTLRFSAELVTTEIVTHEVLHAALCAYRMDVTTYVNLGNGIGRREETLAYIHGDLCRATSDALRRFGLLV